jgi:hypothetical protein
MSKQAKIISSGDGFAVAVDGENVRTGFNSRSLAAAWAARKGLYRRTTKPTRPTHIPAEFVEECIWRLRPLAKMSGDGYPRFLADAKAGVYGPLYRIAKNCFGLKYGNWKRAMEARIIR